MTGQWVATWTSFEGAPLQTFFSLEKEKMRQRVNDWIRQSSPVDAVVDFDRALADPQEPVRLKREFDCGDHLHPSDAGYAEWRGMSIRRCSTVRLRSGGPLI